MIGQKNVTCRVLKSFFYYINIRKMRTPPPPGSHETNVLTEFHENWAKNVTSCKTAPPTGGHVFSPIWTIFQLFHDDWAKILTSSKENCPANWRPCIIGTHPLTKFHEDLTRNVASRVKNAPPTGGHVLQWTETTFEPYQHIIKTNILTKFFSFFTPNDLFQTRWKYYWDKPFTKFQEDRTRNVASRVFTNQMWTTDGRTDDGQRPITKDHLSNQVS
ncbi:hypothetical protein DPMN_167175 [Dreissena polymorpha]|uniref:Uncharacterized protein n=1 Tax=Dreissena polymorpha TaxID=45954 RepID=A0A9D4EZW5_DREPO|nr:hypothetical protein DPMN_167175 [Dreissena polymorpha]